MPIRAYLCADDCAEGSGRVVTRLQHFVACEGARVAAWYIDDSESHDSAALKQLIADLNANDIVLVKTLESFTQLPAGLWHRLCHRVEHDSVSLVAIDLPGSHAALTAV